MNDSRSATGGKLPRANLEQKIQILDVHHRSGKAQSETVDEFKGRFAISTSSFSEWLKHEADLRKRYEQSVRLADTSGSHIRQSKRKAHYKYEKINSAMDDLVQQRIRQGLKINEKILREYWVKYANEFGVEDEKRLKGFSHGWLSQFKKRHGLDKKIMSELTKQTPKSNGSIVEGNSNSSAEDAANTFENRFYEVGQLLNSSTQMSTPVAMPDFRSKPPASSAMGDSTDHNKQQNEMQAQQGQMQPFSSLVGQEMNSFNAQTFPLMSPFIRLENQVNENHANTNQHNRPMRQQRRPRTQSATPRFASPVPSSHIDTNGQNGGVNLSKDLLSGENSTIDQLSAVTDNTSNAGTLSASPATGNGLMDEENGEDDEFTVNMEDIEKFTFQWCDKFFHDHQDQFPKTNKIFRAFKDSFMREKFKIMMTDGASTGRKQINNNNNNGNNINNSSTVAGANDTMESLMSSNGGLLANSSSNGTVDNFFLRNARPKRNPKSS